MPFRFLRWFLVRRAAYHLPGESVSAQKIPVTGAGIFGSQVRVLNEIGFAAFPAAETQAVVPSFARKFFAAGHAIAVCREVVGRAMLQDQFFSFR